MMVTNSAFLSLGEHRYIYRW